MTTVRHDLLEDRGQDSVHSLSAQQMEIDLLLGDALNSLHFLSKVPSVNAYINDPSLSNQADVEFVFSAFVEVETVFDQVRLLSSEGMELIRINNDGGKAVVVPEDDLQDKSNREYYQASIGLAENEVYISPLNLNQENGVIEEPYMPTLRFATPLFDENDQLRAILVFNLIPNEIFNIARSFHPDANYYLINERGDVMYASVENAESILYASDLGHDVTMGTIFPRLPERPTHVDYLIDEPNGRLLTYAPIIVGNGTPQRHWLLVREQALDTIVMPINQTIVGLIVTGLLGLLASVLVSVPLAYRTLRPLQDLHTASKHLRQRNWQSSIDLAKLAKGRDEIGELAQSFEDTLYELRNFYTQLETLVKDRTLELEWANEQLKQIDAVKTRFMEDIAHDIRTPLATIMVNTSMLERRPDDIDRYNSRIVKQVQRIESLMENVQIMSHVDISSEMIRFEEVDCQEVIEPIIESHRTTIEELSLKLHLDIATVPPTKAHRFMFEQLFENLLTNAIKYTVEGSINIKLHYTDEHIVLVVQDTGIGIAEEEIPLVTRRYYRTEKVRQSSTAGTGIGLAIVQEIVRLHGGELNINSKLGEGTAITVTLPLVDEGDEAETN